MPGGTRGTTSQASSLGLGVDVGDRYAFASVWEPGQAHPVNLARRFVPPDEALPAESELRAAWDARCGG